MPRDLTRATVTAASRIMLPTHAGFSVALGGVWAWQADERTAVHSLYALRDIWPIQATGGLLFALGALGVVSLLLGRRLPAAVLLFAGAVGYAALTVAVAWSLPGSPLASYSAPLWPAYVATAHLASAISLAADEWTDTDHRNQQP